MRGWARNIIIEILWLSVCLHFSATPKLARNLQIEAFRILTLVPNPCMQTALTHTHTHRVTITVRVNFDQVAESHMQNIAKLSRCSTEVVSETGAR